MLEARAQLAGQRRHRRACGSSTAAGRRSRARTAPASRPRRRGTAPSARPASGAPREALLQHLLQRLLAVDHARVDRQAGALERKARMGLRQALLVAQQAEQVFAVAAVGDGEGRVQADARRIARAAAARPRCGRCRTRAGRAAAGWRRSPAPGAACGRRAAAATAPRGARSSAAGCAAGRHRPAPAGPRVRPASASCPSRRRRRSAAAAARRRRLRGRGTPPGAARRSGSSKGSARTVARRAVAAWQHRIKSILDGHTETRAATGLKRGTPDPSAGVDQDQGNQGPPWR